jgi:DNA methyltransferase 1-associated protein 1
MTSHDVRDMLDLPDTAAPRPSKKQKIAVPRPSLKGLAREVQSLGGDNPIAIVPEVSVFKKRRLASRKPAAKWELKPFKNSARKDGLVLRHWRRKAEIPAAPVREDGSSEQTENKVELEVDDSTFAKFNVQVDVPKYDDEQYNSKLQSEDWSKDETDYLMHLIQEYDLRWPVIWDRYDYAPAEMETTDDAMILAPKVRSMEDLKTRYYAVAAKMMALHKPPEHMATPAFNLHELMINFNPTQETARKKFAEAAFYRTKEEANEEQSLLLELKRILARSDKLSEERRELYARLEAPPSTGNIGIYTSSQGLQQLLQQLMTVDKSKKRKSLMGSEGISPASGPSGLQQSSFDRRDSTNRESVSGPSTANNKKGSVAGPSERRQLTEEEERIYGVSHHERIGTSGPAFRHEKVNRPINTKSSVQQTKLLNTLSELEIPARLIMPTADVGAIFESLLQSINVMLEARKVSDKLTGEIGLLKAQIAEREKKARAERGEPEPEGEDTGDQDGDDEDDDVKIEEGEKEKSAAPSTRGGSTHKRSASVLSAVSDKSTKRQKK